MALLLLLLLLDCCTENKIPWRTEFFQYYPPSFCSIVEMILLLAHIDHETMRVSVPEALLWRLPPEILFEIFGVLLTLINNDERGTTMLAK
jgi:hypothetical protein